MSNFSVTTERSGRRTFGEHDDRWSDNRGGGKFRGNRGNKKFNSRGRGSFRSGSGYRGGGGGGYKGRGNRGYYAGRDGYKRGRGGSFGPRSRLEDDDGDISMNDNRPASSKRFSPYRGGRSNRGQKYYGDDNPSGFSRPGPHPSGKNTWYKVTIPKAKTAGKEFILKTLSENVEYSFTPVNFHFEQEKAVFHVQDKQVTSALHSLSSRIPMPSGMKMLFLIKPDRAPLFVSDEETEKLKVVMSNRYDPSTKSLNLTSLSSDQSLQSDGMTMNLSAAHVMTCVVKIIQENIPELECLDVSQNHISKLDGLSSLVEHTPNLTKLNLGANKLSYIEELRCLYKWKLTELNLDGNELCDKFKDQSSYVR